MISTRFSAALLAISLALPACQDLQVTNPNAPDRERALANPGDVEALIASSWFPYWNRSHVQGTVYHPLNAISSIFSTSVADNGGLFLSEIPRPVYDNNPTSDVSGLARFPYYDFYSGLDSGSEGLRAIDAGMEIGTGGADTERARAWAKFTQGLNLGMLALFYDQAMVATEDTDLEDPSQLQFRPYPEVLGAAVASLEEAIAIAQSNPFTIPELWMRLDRPFTNDVLVRAAHSFIAKFLVLSARWPEDRDDVDWQTVVAHADAGVQDDIWILHDQDELGSSNFRRRIQADFFNGFRMSYFFLGKADISGNYQEWLAQPIPERTRVHITTPDRRISAGDSTSDGKYMRYLSTNPFRDERGTWRQSFYQFYRWEGAWRDEPLVWLTVDELRLFKAEAALRTGDPQTAADLINVTRVANGELPPVTTQGVPQTADCVPRTDAGACEDLLGALMYERVMETMGFEAWRQWTEARGFGLLYPGTFVHLPVPGRELETLGLAIYTFGGVGGEGAAR